MSEGASPEQGARNLLRVALPVIRLLTAVRIIKRSWDRLEPGERRKAGRLIAQFRGRPSNLNAKERRELFRIARKAAGLGS